MALIDPAGFDGKAITLIYVAGRIGEAQKVEAVLTEHGVDYAVDAEPFERHVLGLFPVQDEGVGFYVVTPDAESSRQALRQARLLQGLVEEEGPGGD